MYEATDTNGIHFRAHQPSLGRVFCIIVKTSNFLCVLCKPPLRIQKTIFFPSYAYGPYWILYSNSVSVMR
jgi:hypothetical protein